LKKERPLTDRRVLSTSLRLLLFDFWGCRRVGESVLLQDWTGNLNSPPRCRATKVYPTTSSFFSDHGGAGIFCRGAVLHGIESGERCCPTRDQGYDHAKLHPCCTSCIAGSQEPGGRKRHRREPATSESGLRGVNHDAVALLTSGSRECRLKETAIRLSASNDHVIPRMAFPPPHTQRVG
jgi:hypothetical protein